MCVVFPMELSLFRSEGQKVKNYDYEPFNLT